MDACRDNTLPANDDGSTGAVALPTTLNFFGTNYSTLYVNNNGNVTFDGPLSTFTPFGLQSASRVIIAPYFADVDTRGAGSDVVTYGSGTYNGRSTFCVDWVNVGYYFEHTDKLNSFQLLLVDRSDVGAGDFDIYMNYDKIKWETGDASGGRGGLGGSSARMGYSNGSTTSFEIPGSGINGYFLDSNTATGLIYHDLNSSQLGRYTFAVRNGQINQPPTVFACTGTGCAYSGNESSAIALSGATASDSDGDRLTYSWSYTTVSAHAGASCSFDDATTLNPNFTCNDNGTFNVTLSVNDGTNPAVTASARVTVNNVPPTITSFAADRSSALTGKNVTFTGQATDPSSNDLAAGLTWAFSVDGGTYSAFGSSSQLTSSFSSCGSHTVSAEAQDKDGGTSVPATANTVSAYDGAWQPPLYYGQPNVARAGSVIPVKILVGCNGTYLTNLAPAIQLIKGTTDSPANYVPTLSASSADTTGVMRLASPQYIYNLLVPTGYPTGTQFTIRVRPFGDSDPADSMYVQITTK